MQKSNEPFSKLPKAFSSKCYFDELINTVCLSKFLGHGIQIENSTTKYIFAKAQAEITVTVHGLFLRHNHNSVFKKQFLRTQTRRHLTQKPITISLLAFSRSCHILWYL